MIIPCTQTGWDYTGFEFIFQLATGPDDLVAEQPTWTSTFDNWRGVTGNSNFMDNTNTEFYVTGCQLEVGEIATSFEHRSYAEELARCQRYYEIVTGAIRAFDYTNYIGIGVPFKVTKRAIPTNTFIDLGLNLGVSFQNFITNGMNDIVKQEGVFPQFNAASGGYSYGFRIHSDAEL